MSTELLAAPEGTAMVLHTGPKEMFRQATDVAGVCGEIVKKTAKVIQRRKYVCVEGWQAIATAHGCMLSIESVAEDEEQNVVAIASVRRMSDGAILAKAEGFVGSDESTWRNRPRYARRAMAQTRAMSRAARSAFAHVVVMIDSGLSTTPAEEMVVEGEVVDEPHHEPARPEPRPEDTKAKAARILALAEQRHGAHLDGYLASVLSALSEKRGKTFKIVQELDHADLDAWLGQLTKGGK